MYYPKSQIDVYRMVLSAIEAWPRKRLITYQLVDENNDRCAIGTLIPEHDAALTLGGPLDTICKYNREPTAEIVAFNNTFAGTPEQRYIAVCTWLRNKIAQMEEHAGEPLVADLPEVSVGTTC